MHSIKIDKFQDSQATMRVLLTGKAPALMHFPRARGTQLKCMFDAMQQHANLCGYDIDVIFSPKKWMLISRKQSNNRIKHIQEAAACLVPLCSRRLAVQNQHIDIVKPVLFAMVNVTADPPSIDRRLDDDSLPVDRRFQVVRELSPDERADVTVAMPATLEQLINFRR